MGVTTGVRGAGSVSGAAVGAGGVSSFMSLASNPILMRAQFTVRLTRARKIGLASTELSASR
eukprot:558119-Karenia_brevis.AAC.2